MIDQTVTVTSSFPEGTITLTEGVPNQTAVSPADIDSVCLYYAFTPSETTLYRFSCDDSIGCSYWPDKIWEIAADGTISYLYLEGDEFNATSGSSYLLKYDIRCTEAVETTYTMSIVKGGSVSEHELELIRTVAATCAEPGSELWACKNCDYTETKIIPATGAHNWKVVVDKAATCTTAGSQHEECGVCHAKRNTTTIAATGHSWSAWTQTKAPTALAEGTDTRTCSKCGATETRTVAKLSAYIKLNATSITLQMKQSTTAVKVTGMQTGDRIASWKSSNTKIVKVTSKGKITAQKKTGTAYVTVKLKSGKSAKIKVKVQKAAVATTKIRGLKSRLIIKVKRSVQLKPTLSPITTKDKIIYSSSNKKIATVSAKGKITAKKAGKVKITVKAGKKKFVITVTVKK